MLKLMTPFRCLLGICLACTFWPVAAEEAAVSLPRYSPTQKIQGRIVIAGNRATNPIMGAWIEAFGKQQPAVSFELRVDTRVSTDAFDAAIADYAIDLVPAARELVPSEIERLTASLGGPPLVFAIASGSHATKSATHALAFYVSAENPLKRISIDQLKEIYGPKGKITRWGQLGLKGEWADKPITLYGVPISDPNGNPLGITNYLRLRLFDGKAGMRRSLYQIDSTGPRLNQHMLTNIVRHIGQDRYSIGYSGFAFATPKVRQLSIAETPSGPWFRGTPAEVRERTYPLTRTIYLAANQPVGTSLKPELKEFLRFVLSHEGQSVLANGDLAYLPLTSEVVTEERRKIN